MLLRSFIFLPTLIFKFFNDTKDELRFRPEILRDVEETVERVGGKGRTRIGIHVRRTDYDNYLRRDFSAALVGKSYYQVYVVCKK